LEEAKLIDVHLNDAYGKWDDDMLPGTVHLWESIEFFVYLLNSNYNAKSSISRPQPLPGQARTGAKDQERCTGKEK
ncbi:unnamed protein product, partial [marine sediment metagenome]